MNILFSPGYTLGCYPSDVDGDTPLKELESKKEFLELMKNSWQHDPKARPKFEEIVDILASLLKKMKE